MFVEWRSSVGRWNLPLEKNGCELNLMENDVSYWRAMYVHLAHDVVRAMFDSKLRRETISLNVKILCSGCHVLRSMCSRAIRLSSGMPMVRLRVSIRMPSFSRT